MNIEKLSKELQEILETEYKNCNNIKLYEFADFTPEDTNLSVVVWVDGPRNMPHGKRIKFQNNNYNRLNGGEMIPMTISQTPQLLKNINYKLKIHQKEVEAIKKWVILNKDALNDYAEGNITTKQLYQLIKPLEE